MFLILSVFLMEDGMGNVSKWKETLAERAISRQTPSLMQYVYGKSTVSPTSVNEENYSSEDESEDEFFKPKEEVKKVGHLLPCTMCTLTP